MAKNLVYPLEKKKKKHSKIPATLFLMHVDGIGMVKTVVDTSAEASTIQIDTLKEAIRSTVRPTSDQVTGPTLKHEAVFVRLVISET